MMSETQDLRYFERMGSSLGDKVNLLKWVEGDRVLDVGAGGGELAETVRLTGKQVWALDGSHAAAKRMRESFPELNVLTGLAHEVEYLAPSQHFTTVLCSSIFHEVYSYGIPETGPYSIKALSTTLDALRNSLEDGGRLVIRDGINPSDWDREVFVRFNEQDGVDFWHSYHRHAPFASWAGDGPRCIKLHPTDDPMVWKGNLESAMEFLYTYTWGWQSSEREMKELYGVFTQEEYVQFVTDHGFTVENVGSYCQPGYFENLSPKVSILDADGQPVDYPATNFYMVARKS